MGFDFDYRALDMVLAAGEVRPFQALQFIGLASATSAVQIAPNGKAGSFGPFSLKQTFESPDGAPLGTVLIKNNTGVPVTVTVITSNKRMVFSPSSSAQSVTIDGTSVTVPVSLASGAVGPAAHGAAVSGNPVEIGAEARSSERAAVTAGQVARIVSDLLGRLITVPYADPSLWLSGVSGAAAGAGGTAQIIAAQAATFRIYVTDLVIDNTNATATQWQLMDGAAVVASGEISANGQVVVNFNTPLRLTAATALSIKQTAAAALVATASGFKGT